MDTMEILKKRQDKLIKDITALLDSFLIGTVAKSPSMTGHNLTTKVEGKTVTLYVRKNIAGKAQHMSRRYKKLWALVQVLSKVNWDLLNKESH